MVSANLRNRSHNFFRSNRAHGTSWHDKDWKEEGGFNPDSFQGLQAEDLSRLNALGLGPQKIINPGAKTHLFADVSNKGHWADGPNKDIDKISGTPWSEHIYGKLTGGGGSDNRGLWENAAKATGRFNIGSAEELMGFASEIENYKANNPDFMKDGKLTGKDVFNLKNNWNQAEPVAEVAKQAVNTPEEQTPAVVKQVEKKIETPSKPTIGTDIMSPKIKAAADRIAAFKGGGTIPISDPENTDKKTADLLKDYKFVIASQLTPSTASQDNAIQSALSLV